MSTNLADSFGRGSRPGKNAAGRGTAQASPATPPVRTKEKLVAAGIWMPVSLRDRINAHCQEARISQAEVMLRAVDHAAGHIDQLAANPEPEPIVEQTGGLFPRPQAAPSARNTGTAVSVRFRSDHLTTLTRLAADHGLKRSVLIKLSLIDYLDYLERRDAP